MGWFSELHRSHIRKKIFSEGIGVAMGSGGLKGFFHIGVLEALDELKIPIRRFAGTSAGAIAVSVYAAGIPVADFKDFALSFNTGHILSLGNPVLPKSGILKADAAVDFLRKTLKSCEFKDLKIPVSIVATDIIKGEKVVIEDGDVSLAVRGSLSVPAIFEPVILGDRLLVDGGVLENLPVATLRERWDGVVFASSLTPKLSIPQDIQIKKTKRKPFLSFIKEIPLFQGIPWFKEYEFTSVESSWASILVRAWDILAYENYDVYLSKNPPDMMVTIDPEHNPGMNEMNRDGIGKLIEHGREKTLACFREFGIR